MTRPEGLPLAILVAVGWRLGPGRRARGAEAALPWAAAVAGLLVLVNNRALTGSWVGTSLADKSLFANFGIPAALGIVAEYGVDVIRGLLLGFYPSSATIGFNRGWAALCFPPLGLLLVAAAALRRHPLTPPVRLWLLAAAVLVRARLAEHVPGRPFQSLHPLGLPHPARPGRGGRGRAGARRRRAPRDRAVFNGRGRRCSSCSAGCRRCASPPSTARWRARSTGATSPPPRWIARSLPRGVAMANVATSVEYLTGHRNVNLHGVTSPAFFGTRAGEREAGMLEGLARLADRPPYLITTAASQEGSALLRELVDGPPLFRTTSFGDEIEIYRTRYDALVGRGARAPAPDARRRWRTLAEVDRLNVCDPADEAAHGYRFDSRLGNLRLHGAARVDQYARRERRRAWPTPGGPSSARRASR